MRANIDQSGYQRVTVAIDVADDNSRAIAGCRAVNHSVA
jgi:hypothetical protein